VHVFMEDSEDLPYNPYGAWSNSVLDRNETLAQDIHLHLQKIGKYVRAEDLVDFMDTPEMRERTKLDKRIVVLTAQRWMKKMDYRWTKTGLKGQYVNGHEQEDIVAYRQNVFLPGLRRVRWRGGASRVRGESLERGGNI
jgi:hypothetical protein